MGKLVALVALATLPRVGFASALPFHLLNSSLTFFGETWPGESGAVLQGEPPPASTPEAAAATPTPTREVPSLGAAIGLMASGGGALIVGVIFVVYDFLWWATDFGNFGGNPTVGIVLLAIGDLLVVTGAVLLIIGNHKRKLRTEMLAARNVSVSYNPIAKAPMLAYGFQF
jgi:hypothetical protein